MSQANPFANDSYAGFDVAARAEPNDRAAFLQKTYLHLAGAVGVFSLLQVLFYLTVPMSVTTAMFGSPLVWGGILVGFMGLSMLANKWAANHTSANLQYAGLGVYVLGLSVLFIPMIKIAGLMGEQQFGSSMSIIGPAALATLGLFAVLTIIAFVTGSDFSFLRGIVILGSVLALIAIAGGLIFGWSLGLWFSVAMVGLAGGTLLFHTGQILNHYPIGSHVAASLALFAALGTLFWYVLRIAMTIAASRD